MDGENEALDLVVVIWVCSGLEPFKASGISEMESGVLGISISAIRTVVSEAVI